MSNHDKDTNEIKRSRSSKEVTTPFQMHTSPEGLAKIAPNAAERLQALERMGGGQDPRETCEAKFHQEICVEGTVTTHINAECHTAVFCRSGGIGPGCPPNGFPPPTECSFKFFQNLCVEVNVEIDADSHCEIDRVVCGPAREGGCPPD